VRLENGLLTIDGSLAAGPDSAWTPLYAEYRFGGFHREFRLSEAIDTDGIEARMTDGVLEVRLPKRSQHRPRQVSVRAG
jgi:HSP20 family molecular chaperone IbpA